MKIHEWLHELDSHTCYDHEKLSRDFREKTEQEPSWFSYPVEEANKTVGHYKGLLQPITGIGEVIDGWSVAESLADKYAPHVKRANFYGRGSNFREAHRALKEANI